MARAALQSNKRIGRGPVPGARFVPVVSVIVAILLSAMPLVVQNGWFPDLGFLTLIAWRLRREDAWPAWWAAPLGLFNDAISGSPVGLSVTVWTFAMLVLDFADRRTIWRDYWIEWTLAALLILMDITAQWQVAAWVGAKLPFMTVVPNLLISAASFPLLAWSIAWIDRWRFNRV
jgi:rod shape-determining protein MreD